MKFHNIRRVINFLSERIFLRPLFLSYYQLGQFVFTRVYSRSPQVERVVLKGSGAINQLRPGFSDLDFLLILRPSAPEQMAQFLFWARWNLAWIHFLFPFIMRPLLFFESEWTYVKTNLIFTHVDETLKTLFPAPERSETLLVSERDFAYRKALDFFVNAQKTLAMVRGNAYSSLSAYSYQSQLEKISKDLSFYSGPKPGDSSRSLGELFIRLDDVAIGSTADVDESLRVLSVRPIPDEVSSVSHQLHAGLNEFPRLEKLSPEFFFAKPFIGPNADEVFFTVNRPLDPADCELAILDFREFVNRMRKKPDLMKFPADGFYLLTKKMFANYVYLCPEYIPSLFDHGHLSSLGPIRIKKAYLRDHLSYLRYLLRVAFFKKREDFLDEYVEVMRTALTITVFDRDPEGFLNDVANAPDRENDTVQMLRSVQERSGHQVSRREMAECFARVDREIERLFSSVS